MELPIVSIIIPTYNRAHLIGETLDSVVNQTHTEWACFVVDDGSTDDTEEVVKKYTEKDSRFHYAKRPRNRPKGPNACRNYGFEISKSTYVYWFDSDDLLKPDALSQYLSAFTEDTDVVIAPVEKTDLESGIVLEQNRISSENLIIDYFNNKVCYFVCGPIWKRSFLNQQDELFDEYLGHHDEWDFNLRMIYRNPKKILLDTPQVIYRQHKDSFKTEIPKGNHKQIESAFKARFKHLTLISEQYPTLAKEIKTLIAHLYKKTVRNFLISKQKGWFRYYRKAIQLYLSLFDFKSITKMTVGIVSYKLFRKGYSWFN
jgi:glycosyltransferase involved in cell wall biosynthesis